MTSFSTSKLKNTPTSVEEKKTEALPGLAVCDRNIS